MDQLNKDKYQSIITAITELRNHLGEDIFTVAASALEENTQSIVKIDEVSKRMSALNSEITTLIFESKLDTDIQLGEASIISRISLMSGRLADLQYGLSKIKKKRQEWQAIIEQISAEANDLAKHLMSMQDYTREIIHDFRIEGFATPQGDFVNLMDATKP